MSLIFAAALAASDQYVPRDPENEFERWAAGHTTGPIVHKDAHYFDIYKRHFGPARAAWHARRRAGDGRPFQLVEIGVQSGGGLEMWKSFFGEDAHLHGIDINPATRRFRNHSRHIQVHLGSTSDDDFMQRLVQRLPLIDIVIDDGSHHSLDIWRAFTLLYPLLRTAGGVYLVEDLHTNYWLNAEFQERGEGFSFINRAKTLVDELNAYDVSDKRFNPRRFARDSPLSGLQPTAFTNSTASIHFYNGVVVMEKQERTGPFVDVQLGSLKVGHSHLEHKRPPGTPTARPRPAAGV